MIWLAMMLQAATAPLVPSTSTSTPQGNDIVVVARNGQAALDACIARDCPPDQEIKAALVVASRAFLAGDYSGARPSSMRPIRLRCLTFTVRSTRWAILTDARTRRASLRSMPPRRCAPG
jgi:hypothetical protein